MTDVDVHEYASQVCGAHATNERVGGRRRPRVRLVVSDDLGYAYNVGTTCTAVKTGIFEIYVSRYLEPGVPAVLQFCSLR